MTNEERKEMNWLMEDHEAENEENATMAIVIALVVFICAVALAFGLGYLAYELLKHWLC